MTDLIYGVVPPRGVLKRWEATSADVTSTENLLASFVGPSARGTPVRAVVWSDPQADDATRMLVAEYADGRRTIVRWSARGTFSYTSDHWRHP